MGDRGGTRSGVGPDRYDRLAAAFEACRRLAGDARQRMLAEVCAGDDSLRSEVLDLLRMQARTDAFSDRAVREGAGLRSFLSAAGGTEAPQEIGPYRILRLLGEGGMGVVYEAERSFPRRRVALKLIRPTMRSAAAVRRFEREAAVLARLQHPGIAQLYDFGTFSSPPGARPYFALELVEGEDLRSYAGRGSPTLTSLLQVIARVCDAVQHAHDRGIIHRDLKPDNILVDAEGQPKVLDFGVAHVLDPSESFAANLTATGQVVGTLAYLAPEQLDYDRDRATPLTDVYALGAISFELLAGQPPHTLAGLTPAQGLRLVLEKPATSLDAAVRVPIDVATIIGKAIEREPERRYVSAAAVAADLRRFLAHEPIVARPPSRTYRMSRFVRRHRALTASVFGVIAALSVGLALSILFAVEARERDRESTRQRYRASIVAA
ncbi:MAG: serine/threonine-protein kinase, partial [Planctomycetota bacterium]